MYPQAAFQTLSGGCRGGQHQFATQTLRIHLIGIDQGLISSQRPLSIVNSAALCGSNQRIDNRQITHLFGARLKHDLYDFSSGVLGLFPVPFLV